MSPEIGYVRGNSTVWWYQCTWLPGPSSSVDRGFLCAAGVLYSISLKYVRRFVVEQNYEHTHVLHWQFIRTGNTVHATFGLDSC